MSLLSEKELATARGELYGHLVTRVEKNLFKKIMGHYDAMEEKMDEVEGDDFFGTEGWRHFFGIPGAD